jgi:hypothetical protein
LAPTTPDKTIVTINPDRKTSRLVRKRGPAIFIETSHASPAATLAALGRTPGTLPVVHYNHKKAMDVERGWRALRSRRIAHLQSLQHRRFAIDEEGTLLDFDHCEMQVAQCARCRSHLSISTQTGCEPPSTATRLR